MDNDESSREVVTLSSWLRESIHPTIQEPPTSTLDEIEAPNQKVRDHLATRLIEHRSSLRVARDLTDALGWSNVRRRFVPASVSVARGDFGEMIATAILEDVAELVVPVKKTRFQLHAGATQPSADVVAFTLSEDRKVVELNLVEAKMRTGRDSNAAVEAHEQLRTWHSNHFVDILYFVAQRLETDNPSLYEAFIDYLESESDRSDRFHIILTWESAKWSDDVLTNLPDGSDLMTPLDVRVARISKLAELADELYEELERRLANP